MERPTILLVEDDPVLLEYLPQALADWGYEPITATSGSDAVRLSRGRLLHLALVDFHLPGKDGLEVLREIKRSDSSVEVVMMTGDPTVRTAVAALKDGASDYIAKPLIPEELQHLLRGLLERRFLREEVDALRRRMNEQLPNRELIGASAPMAELRELIRKAAAATSAVLIEGESGTGKELVAEALHRLSSRSAGPFVTLNCAAIPAELVESELFGHVRGAFSGAVSDTPGLIRSAHGGSIFFDEISELPPALQPKLLRVLQEKEVRPVGSPRTFPVDVRVIAATNRNLEAAVKAGAFREDLYYRLNVLRLVIPPLRERKDDVPALVTHFVRALNRRFNRHVQGVSAEALSLLTAHDYPGNVRELENLLERAYAFGVKDEVRPRDLAVLQRPAWPAAAADGESGPLPTLAEHESTLIRRALRMHDNKTDRTARALGVSTRTVQRWVRKHGLP
jgi:DNA-binding NtrC family response regulator